MDEKIIELLKQPDFMNKIINEDDVFKVKSFFKEEGIDISDEDLKKLGNIIYHSLDTISQLSEEDMKNISGGADPPTSESSNKETTGTSPNTPAELTKKEKIFEAIHENKGYIIVGSVSLCVGTIYSIKTVMRRVRKNREKSWIKKS